MLKRTTTSPIFTSYLCRSGYWALRDNTDPWTLSTPRNKTRRAAVARYVAATSMQLPAAPSSPPRTDMQGTQLGPMRRIPSPKSNTCNFPTSMLVRGRAARRRRNVRREEEGRSNKGTIREQFLPPSRNSLQSDFFRKIRKIVRLTCLIWLVSFPASVIHLRQLLGFTNLIASIASHPCAFSINMKNNSNYGTLCVVFPSFLLPIPIIVVTCAILRSLGTCDGVISCFGVICP